MRKSHQRSRTAGRSRSRARICSTMSEGRLRWLHSRCLPRNHSDRKYWPHTSHRSRFSAVRRTPSATCDRSRRSRPHPAATCSNRRHTLTNRYLQNGHERSSRLVAVPRRIRRRRGRRRSGCRRCCCGCCGGRRHPISTARSFGGRCTRPLSPPLLSPLRPISTFGILRKVAGFGRAFLRIRVAGGRPSSSATSSRRVGRLLGKRFARLSAPYANC